MEKTIKANKDNDRKFLEGLNLNPSNTSEKDEEKKESTDNTSGNLEYFCE